MRWEMFSFWRLGEFEEMNCSGPTTSTLDGTDFFYASFALCNAKILERCDLRGR